MDYHFVDGAGFDSMVAAGELAEWAVVHGERYGTPQSELGDAAARGRHVVLDIDVQGARQIRSSVPDALLVFVLPPSVDVMVERLTRRGTEGDEQVVLRLRSALEEMGALPEFDHAVINDTLDRCLGEIRGIVRAETLRTARARALEKTVDEMRSRIVRLIEEEFSNVSG